MKLLLEATRRVGALLNHRLTALLLAAAAVLTPTLAWADGGEAAVKLNFTQADLIYLYISLGIGAVSILGAVYFGRYVLSQDKGSDAMQEVGMAIREGALAYLRRQVVTMAVFVVILAAVLVFMNSRGASMELALWTGASFIGGVAASYIAGYSGMIMAVQGNMRTANAALTSYKKTTEIAFRSGAVAGLVTVGMGLIGATLIFLFARDNAVRLLITFGFGGSLAALFMRVGGGIFTKAADVGADLVGKVEAGIPEDDPRNPATIADNVGDNVGDCAGMAADIFESYEVTLVAAIVLGAATAGLFDQSTWMKLIIFALLARGVGIIASIAGIFFMRGTDDVDADPLKRIRMGFYSSAGVAVVLTLGVAYYLMGGMGKPIVSNQLLSLDALQRTDYKTIRDIRDELKIKNPLLSDFPVDEIVKDPRLKTLGLSDNDPDMQTAIEQALSFDAETAPLPPDPSQYTEVTLDGNNPALQYSVPEPTDPDQTTQQAPKEETLEDWIKAGNNHAFELHVVMPAQPSPQPGGQPIPPSDFDSWIGPASDSYMQKVIQKFNSGGFQTKGQVTIVNDRIMHVYVHGTGDETSVMYAIDGPIEHPLTVQLKAPPTVLGSPDQVEAAQKAGPNNTSVRQPQNALLALGVVDHTKAPWYLFFIAIFFGVVMAFAIEFLTDYYVSTHKNPVKEVAGIATAGPAPMIIQGFAYAMESSVFMVFAIVLALIVPLILFPPSAYGSYIMSFYGIALVGLGLLTTTGYILAMDTFGPISDNAQGVYEMSGAAHENEAGAKAVQRLDAAGNTTKALTKGFAITTAVVAAVALFHSYLDSAKLGTIGLRLDIPEIFLGLLIGGAAPFLFSAFAINAVGRAAVQLIEEVRRQFKADPGILKGTSRPNYGRCVELVTKAAQKELLGPGILAIFLPIAVAFGFSIGKAPTIIDHKAYNLTGAEALGGFLAGAILAGQLLAVVLANSGGMWDNAKKLIEDGMHGGKGTEAHKAGVVVDTVGDPFKDTAGPALNPLIKVMNLVGLLLAPTIIYPWSNSVLITVTSVAVLLLIGSIVFSKTGSLSSEMQRSAAEARAEEAGQPALADGPRAAAPKRTIKVEEPAEPQDSGDSDA